MRVERSWNVEASCYAVNTFNPIRNIVDNLQINPNPDKPMIALSIGDPTVFGNLTPAQQTIDAVVESVKLGKYNGYGPSVGYLQAREAVAKHMSCPGLSLEAKDIILCSGCSSSLDMCITCLGSPGKNILVPRPGFPLYKTLAEGLGIATKFYDLMPERNWEVNTEMLEKEINCNTVAIVINNPSNPCGSVFGKEHLLEIIEVAKRNKVPIIADEIYDYFTFTGHRFHPIASLTEDVPVLTCGGLTKRFLVPGWRMGWIAICDRDNIFGEHIRGALVKLSQRIIGSNTLIQGALPAILGTTPQSFHSNTIEQIQEIAKVSYRILSVTPGLHPIMPQGAMYMMVGIDMEKFPLFDDDLQMVERMISEESVFCLPGRCFDIPNYIRIVLTVPKEQMKDACQRIVQFCARHYVSTDNQLHNLNVNGNTHHHEANGNGLHQDPPSSSSSLAPPTTTAPAAAQQNTNIVIESDSVIVRASDALKKNIITTEVANQ